MSLRTRRSPFLQKPGQVGEPADHSLVSPRTTSNRLAARSGSGCLRDQFRRQVVAKLRKGPWRRDSNPVSESPQSARRCLLLPGSGLIPDVPTSVRLPMRRLCDCAASPGGRRFGLSRSARTREFSHGDHRQAPVAHPTRPRPTCSPARWPNCKPPDATSSAWARANPTSIRRTTSASPAKRAIDEGPDPLYAGAGHYGLAPGHLRQVRTGKRTRLRARPGHRQLRRQAGALQRPHGDARSPATRSSSRRHTGSPIPKWCFLRRVRR